MVSQIYDIDLEWYTRKSLNSKFTPDIPKEKRYMATLATVYLDESGTHQGSPVVTVAGFLSNVEEWAKLSGKWQQILRENRVQHFHMTDFESCQGEFKGWTKENRQSLLNNLLSIIHEHTFFSVSASISTTLYEQYLCDAGKVLCGSAYGVAALFCWTHFGVKLNEIDAWMNCTMEAGAKGYGILQEIFTESSKYPYWTNGNRIRNLTIEKKIDSPPLQAADILAYETWKENVRVVQNEPRGKRYPLKMLGKRNHLWVYVTKEHLLQYNDDIIDQLTEQYKKLKQGQ